MIPLGGHHISQFKLAPKYGISMLALQRGETRIAPPDGEEMLREGDVLYVLAGLIPFRPH